MDNFNRSHDDFMQVIAMDAALLYQRTRALFSLPKSLIPIAPLDDAKEALVRAFKEGDPQQIARAIGDGYRRRGLSFLRWCGSGDLFTEAIQVINITGKEYPESIHWIVTRKPEMVSLLGDYSSFYIMFSLDGTEESMKRKRVVDNINHPRVYYSYLRQEADEDTIGAGIVFNLQQKKKLLPYDNKRMTCPVDAGAMTLQGACKKCRKCFSPGVYR